MPGWVPCICTRLHTGLNASRGVVAHTVRDRCDVFRGRALVTTPDTRHNSLGNPALPAPAVRERGLLDLAGMEVRRRRARCYARARSAQGFSLIELIVVVAMVGVLASIAIGVTPGIINTSKGQSGAAQVSSALRRAREMAISRRRNVQITFTNPNQVVLDQINVPGPGTTAIETIHLEGRIQYNAFGLMDTPDRFGNVTAVQVSGAAAGSPMFTSEGMFTDSNGDPANATITVGIPGQTSTANAVTILGATATIRQYRWDGSRWIE
jgi:prepilin-type N-terminal cleavage/methylation domain-containing protein